VNHLHFAARDGPGQHIVAEIVIKAGGAADAAVSETTTPESKEPNGVEKFTAQSASMVIPASPK
jgi:hypothetical protein